MNLIGPDLSPFFWRGQLPSTQDYLIELVLSLLLVGNEFYEFTNISSSQIFVATSDDAQVQSDCTKHRAPPESRLGEVEINSVIYQTSSYVEGGVGNIWDQTFYRALHNARCYEIIFLIHSHGIGAYNPEVFSAFDAAALAAEMEFVLESFILLND